MTSKAYVFQWVKKDRVKMKWFDSKVKDLKGPKSRLNVKEKESI
jgi:hypothetical protein